MKETTIHEVHQNGRPSFTQDCEEAVEYAFQELGGKWLSNWKLEWETITKDMDDAEFNDHFKKQGNMLKL